MGSGLEVRLSARETEIDDEASGAGLGLSATEIDSLDRNGDNNTINIRYLIGASKTSKFVVGLNNTEVNLDGEAMSYDSNSLEFNWLYTPDRDLNIVTNLVLGSRDYDAINPVFGEKADADFRILTVTGFFPGLWGFKNWIPNANFVTGRDDSD
eukprot:UN29780